MGLLSWRKIQEKRVHLDYASTTPVHPEVLAAMQPYFSEVWANPSALYREGVKARRVVEDARTELARQLHIRAQDVTFTSGGTESNNMALIGFVRALHIQGRAYDDMEIISTRIEHPSVLETLAYLGTLGVHITYVPVTEDGRIMLRAFEEALSSQTVLCTFALVNSEIGVIQDIKKITRAVRRFNESKNVQIRVHTDASQAPLWLSCELDSLGVDMLTLDAGKCYGPKGVGVLAHRHWVTLSPVIFGGGQEGGLRSGTENTALIVGCVKAIMRAQKGYETRSRRISPMRDKCLKQIQNEILQAVINGSIEHRVANNINISLPGFDTEYAVIWLDARGVAASTKSACGSMGISGSYVVREVTGDTVRAQSTLRFTLGEETTEDELAQTIRILKEYLELMDKYKK